MDNMESKQANLVSTNVLERKFCIIKHIEALAVIRSNPNKKN